MNANTATIEELDTIPNFWDDADKICLWLEKHPGKLHNTSTIKRGAKVQGDAYQILSYLVSHKEIRAEGNGAWKKYAAR